MDNPTPYCIHCGVPIRLDEHYDCYDDGDTTVYYALGRCECCGRNYHWQDVFKFHHFEDLEED